jgi:hypothetical protein
MVVGRRLLVIGALLALAGCARSCPLRAAEQLDYGDHTLDCSGAHAERTGQTCTGMDLFVVKDCRTETGEKVSVEVLVSPKSCFGRSPAGACWE